VREVAPSGKLVGRGVGEVRAEAIILADGQSRALSNAFHRARWLVGVQVDARGRGASEVLVVINRSISSSFFAWVVPISDGVYRVGLADRCCVFDKLRKLLKVLGMEPVSEFFGGRVWLGPPSTKPIIGRLILAGDAAAPNKPLTGGGITLAYLTGKAAAKAVTSHSNELRILLKNMALKNKILNILGKILYPLLGENIIDIFSGSNFYAPSYDNHIITLLHLAFQSIKLINKKAIMINKDY